MAFEKLTEDWKRQQVERKRYSDHVCRKIRERGKDLFLRYGIEKVVLFGSIEKGRGSAGSDVDLYAGPLSADRYWQFRRELEEAIGMDVDLYTDGDDPVFIRKILERGRVIHGPQS